MVVSGPAERFLAGAFSPFHFHTVTLEDKRSTRFCEVEKINPSSFKDPLFSSTAIQKSEVHNCPFPGEST